MASSIVMTPVSCRRAEQLFDLGPDGRLQRLKLPLTDLSTDSISSTWTDAADAMGHPRLTVGMRRSPGCRLVAWSQAKERDHRDQAEGPVELSHG